MTPDTCPGITLADLAREVGRDPKDQTVRRALDDLRNAGHLVRDDRKRWHLAVALLDDEDIQRLFDDEGPEA